jgi:hypothetical protein
MFSGAAAYRPGNLESPLAVFKYGEPPLTINFAAALTNGSLAVGYYSLGA